MIRTSQLVLECTHCDIRLAHSPPVPLRRVRESALRGPPAGRWLRRRPAVVNDQGKDDGRQYLAQFYKKVADRDVSYRGAGPSLTALSTIRWHIDASGAQRHPAHSCLLG